MYGHEDIVAVDTDKKRIYQVDVTNLPQQHIETVEVPSVTTVLNIIDEFALRQWASDVATEESYNYLQRCITRGEPLPATWRTLKKYLEDEKKTFMDRFRSGGDRGTAVHDAIDTMIKEGKAPVLSDFDPEVRPYIQSLSGWYNAYGPEFLEGWSEVPVAMVEYEQRWYEPHPYYRGYAGRFDCIAKITKHPRRKRHKDLTGKICLIDFKTNRAGKVYPIKHFAQVEAYAYAFAYMDNPMPEENIVVALGDAQDRGLTTKGGPVHSVGVSYADFSLFQDALNLYNSIERTKKANPNGRKH